MGVTFLIALPLWFDLFQKLVGNFHTFNLPTLAQTMIDGSVSDGIRFDDEVHSFHHHQ